MDSEDTVRLRTEDIQFVLMIKAVFLNTTHTNWLKVVTWKEPTTLRNTTVIY